MQIRISIGGEVREERVIDREVVIGRSSSADVCLQDGEISGRHLAIRPTSDGLEAEDLQSTNGTVLDGGKRLPPGRPIAFRRGMKLSLGGVLVEVIGHAADSASGGATIYGETLLAGAKQGHSELLAVARFQAAAPRLVVSAGHDHRAVELREMEITIGRDAKVCQVSIDHQSVSSRHAALRFSKAGFELRDLDSANGTFAGSERVQDWTSLEPPAALRIGTVECLLSVTPPAAGPDEVDAAGALVEHVVAQGHATRREGLAVLEEYRAAGRGVGELLVARGLLSPAEWVAIHGERDAICAMSRHALTSPRHGTPGWVKLLVVAALLAAAAGLALALR